MKPGAKKAIASPFLIVFGLITIYFSLKLPTHYYQKPEFFIVFCFVLPGGILSCIIGAFLSIVAIYKNSYFRIWHFLFVALIPILCIPVSTTAAVINLFWVVGVLANKWRVHLKPANKSAMDKPDSASS